MRANMIAVLIFHINLINGKIIIEPNPKHPITNGSVTLSVTGITGPVLFFQWYKGPKATTECHILTYSSVSLIKGNKYFSRVNAYSNGSVQITDLQVEDQGNYIVKVQTETQEDANISLQVYETVSKPVITASHSEIKENDFVSLTCASVNADRIIWTKSSSETIKVDNGNIVMHQNGTIIFSSIKSSNEGKYVCRAENLVSSSSSEVYTLSISWEEHESITTDPFGSTTTTQYMTATSDSKHANFHEAATYKSAGVTAGIISGTVLGILLIGIVSILFYKRCGLHGNNKKAALLCPSPSGMVIGRILRHRARGQCHDSWKSGTVWEAHRFQRDRMAAGPPIDGPGQYAIYNNILDPTTGLEPKDEPLYMCLEFASEGTYIELQK